MTTHSSNAPGSLPSPETQEDRAIENGKRHLDELNTLSTRTDLLSDEEKKQHAAHMNHLVEDQAKIRELSLKAEWDPDAKTELKTEMDARYRERVYERGDIGLKGILYGTFERTRNATTGTYEDSASALMRRSIDRVETSDVPGTEETAVFLEQIMEKIDPDEQENPQNPYLILDTEGRRLTYDLDAVDKDLKDLRARARALSEVFPPDHEGAQVVLRELRRFENALMGYRSLDPGMKNYMTIRAAMNAPDAIGFIPPKALKTGALIALGGLTLWALASKNIPYGAVTGLGFFYILYGKKQNEFEAMRTLGSKDLEPKLKELAETGSSTANAKMLHAIVEEGDDRKLVQAWVKKGAAPDSDIDSIHDDSLKAFLKGIPDSKTRIEWLRALLKLNADTLEPAQKYIENKGKPPAFADDTAKRLEEVGGIA